MKWLPIAAVACLFVAACSGDSKPKPTQTPAGATAEPAATSRRCPVDDDICAFARSVESEARAGTLPSFFPGATRELGDRARDLLAVTGEEPRVVSLGCPLVNNTLDCKQSFAVTITSVPDDLIERDTRGLVAIFFSRETPPPPYALFEAPQPAERRLFIDGGERDFDAGIDRGGDTPHWRFVKFATGVPSPVTKAATLPAPRSIDGETTTVMTLGEPYTIRRGELWYFTYLCDACGPGPFPNLYRVYRAADGTLVVDDLKARTLALGLPVAFAADWQSGIAYLATCEANVNCSSLETGAADSVVPARVYKSTDGGVTWRRDGEIPPLTSLVPLKPGEALAVNYRAGFAQPRYWFYPSGRTLEPPPGVGEPLYAVVLYQQTVVWRSQAGIYYDQSGAALFGPLFTEKYKAEVVVADPQYQHTYLSWAETDWKVGWRQKPFYSYVGRVDRDGQMRELFGLPGDTLWIGGEFPRTGDKPPALFGRFRFGTSVDYERDVSFGAVLDLTTGKVRRFTELDAARPPGSFAWMTGLVTMHLPERGESRAPFYRISGAGDCLNIRETPSTSARVLTCLADDVLVGDLGEVRTSGGIEWRLVQTPGHQSGWASTGYLK